MDVSLISLQSLCFSLSRLCTFIKYIHEHLVYVQIFHLSWNILNLCRCAFASAGAVFFLHLKDVFFSKLNLKTFTCFLVPCLRSSVNSTATVVGLNYKVFIVEWNSLFIEVPYDSGGLIQSSQWCVTILFQQWNDRPASFWNTATSSATSSLLTFLLKVIHIEQHRAWTQLRHNIADYGRWWSGFVE